MISARAVMAASGSPPPNDFPDTSTSGSTPWCSIAHTGPVRPMPAWHLVVDVEDPVLVADLQQPAREVVGHRDEPALALDRLEDHAGDVAGIDVLLEDRVQAGDRVVGRHPAQRVRRRRAVDRAGQRPEAVLVRVDLRGHRHRQVRAPVEAAVEDDRRPAGR
jgi:hypothetical protein